MLDNTLPTHYSCKHHTAKSHLCLSIILRRGLVMLLILALSGCGTSPTRQGRALDQVPKDTLEQHQQLAVRLQEAQQAISNLDPRVALTLLQTPLPKDTPDPLLLAYHQLRAEAYEINGEYIASIRERVWMDPLLTDQQRLTVNQTKIWGTLSRLPDAQLRKLYRSGNRDALLGWAELVRLSRKHQREPDVLSREIGQWKAHYRDHPATEQFLQNLLTRNRETRKSGQSINQVALLLPITGPLAAAGAAVRDGFLAANFNQSNRANRPVIRVYDTGSGAHALARQYHKAADEGADIIVGPLTRTAVAELAKARQLSTPILALNYVDGGRWLPKALYQFGLSPEDEARDAARRARLDNHQTAVAFVPQGAWGARVLKAFKESWSDLGGELLETQTYNPSQSDFAGSIGNMLNITESKQRHRKLRQLLNRSLDFEPRRRRDIDFIFLAALPQQARLIAPQLRFHQAARLPVYATSHIFTGVPNAQQDLDLDGVRFCDTPWTLSKKGKINTLRSQLMKSTSKKNQKNTRLHALGFDAYNILPQLGKLDGNESRSFRGMTGNITIDKNRRIHRELAWATFKKGLPVPLR